MDKVVTTQNSIIYDITAPFTCIKGNDNYDVI
jgi:hypothetical protein